MDLLFRHVQISLIGLTGIRPCSAAIICRLLGFLNTHLLPTYPYNMFNEKLKLKAFRFKGKAGSIYGWKMRVFHF